MKTVSTNAIQASAYSKTASVCSPLMQTHTCYSILYKWLKNVNIDLPHPWQLSSHAPWTKNSESCALKAWIQVTKKHVNLHNTPAVPSKGSPVWDWEFYCLFRVALPSSTVDGNPQHIPLESKHKVISYFTLHSQGNFLQCLFTVLTSLLSLQNY